MIHLKTITVDEAVELLYQVVKLPGFQTTPESQEAINSLVEAALMEVAPVWWEGSKKKKKISRKDAKAQRKTQDNI